MSCVGKATPIDRDVSIGNFVTLHVIHALIQLVVFAGLSKSRPAVKIGSSSVIHHMYGPNWFVWLLHSWTVPYLPMTLAQKGLLGQHRQSGEDISLCSCYSTTHAIDSLRLCMNGR